MKVHRALLKGSALAMAAAVAGGALWVAQAPAQVSATAAQTDMTAAMLAPSAVMRPWNTSVVSVSGIVSGSPESVSFSGTATIGTRLAPDPDFGSPSLVVSIDLTGVSGVGSSTRTKYVISGPEIVQKRLVPSYAVDITFPFYKSGTMGTAGARSGQATFSFNVDSATGAVNGAIGSINSSPL
ncbi:MAG: hypothetical protein ACJ8G4_11235 [Burkholderiales bacterium]